MKKKPLIETNPYLQNAITMRRLVARSVRTSCGVEGIRLNKDAPSIVITHRKKKKIYQAAD